MALLTCHDCGGKVSSEAAQCPHCGARISFDNREFMPQKPKSWLVYAILTTCFCIWPLGVVGIVYAAKSDSAWNAGRYKDAVEAANTARKFTLLSFRIWLACIIVFFVVAVIGVIAGAIAG